MMLVILDGYTLDHDGHLWDVLRQYGEVRLYPRSTPAEVIERAAGASILITNKARVGANVIAAAGDLRFIAVSATGYDCVDVEAARRRSIPVANVPIYGTDSVAQWVMSLLLHLCQPVAVHAEAVRAGEWSRSPDFCFWKAPLIELAGKTMGIVGPGRIGRRVGELARAFGMDVIASGRASTAAPTPPSLPRVSLAELARRADVISLHCPLTAETAGIIDRAFLAQVKPGTYLINTARGGLIVEQDLADALNERRLAGAAVDVVSAEPVRSDNPLLQAHNCVITPHIAWATLEARRRLLDATIANVASFLAGRPTHVVNGVVAPS